MLVEVSLKLVYPTMRGKKFKFMVFIFLENALNLSIFTHAPASPRKTILKFLSSHLFGVKLLIPLVGSFSKLCFPQQQERVEETMICYIIIQSENIKITWNIRLCIFCMINFSDVIVLQFCK